MDLAENRKKFGEFISNLGLKQPQNIAVTSKQDALSEAKRLGYPILVRPSYVLGGRAMQKISDEKEFLSYLKTAKIDEFSPLQLDKFLQNAIEIDVDAISDKKDVFIGGILEHIEIAGIHSGDSATVLPSFSLNDEIIDKICDYTKRIALKIEAVGLLNIQLAVCNDEIYIIELNPRASRSVPFISKATGIDLAKVATHVICKETLQNALGFYDKFNKVIEKNGIFMPRKTGNFAIKESVFPFDKLGEKSCFLGPEMKSTGEVMAIDENFYKCFIKSQIAANNAIPTNGALLLNLANFDDISVQIAKNFATKFEIFAMKNLHDFLNELNIKFKPINSPFNDIAKYKINIIIDTCTPNSEILGDKAVCQTVFRDKICYFTTPNSALMASKSLEFLDEKLGVKSLQSWQEI